MKEPLPKWLIGVVAVLLVGGLAIAGFVSIKRVSEPEIDRTKPPASFYGSYSK